MIASTDPLGRSRATIGTRLRTIIANVLSVEDKRARALTDESGLFGHLPELDSMAVATLLTSVEDEFGFVIDDDEVDGEMLETFGALLTFIEGKVSVDAKDSSLSDEEAGQLDMGRPSELADRPHR